MRRSRVAWAVARAGPLPSGRMRPDGPCPCQGAEPCHHHRQSVRPTIDLDFHRAGVAARPPRHIPTLMDTSLFIDRRKS